MPNADTLRSVYREEFLLKKVPNLNVLIENFGKDKLF